MAIVIEVHSINLGSHHISESHFVGHIDKSFVLAVTGGAGENGGGGLTGGNFLVGGFGGSKGVRG